MDCGEINSGILCWYLDVVRLDWDVSASCATITTFAIYAADTSEYRCAMAEQLGAKAIRSIHLIQPILMAAWVTGELTSG